MTPQSSLGSDLSLPFSLSTIPGIDPGPLDPGMPGPDPDFEPGPAPEPDPTGEPGSLPGLDPGFPEPSNPGTILPGTPLPA
jgi:hypothetical protein